MKADRRAKLLFRVPLFLLVTVSIAHACVENDDFADAVNLEGEAGVVIAINVGATKEVDEPPIARDPGGKSVWWSWRAPHGGLVTFDTFGSSFDTLLAVHTGSAVDALELVADNDDGSSNSFGSLVAFEAVAGTEYRIAVDGYEAAAGRIELRWQATPPSNDDFSDALVLEGESGSIEASNTTGTHEPGEPPIDGAPGGSSVWWRWTAPRTAPVFINAFGSTFDTLLGVYTGASIDALTLVAENDDDFALESSVSFEAVAAMEYFIVVDGYEGESGDIVLAWTAGVPSNDAFANADRLEGRAGRVSVTSVAATREPGEPEIAGGTGGSSVWWTWDASETGPVSMSTYKSTFDTVLGVFTGAGVDSLELVAQNDGGPADEASFVQFEAVAGARYHVVIDGARGESGRAVLIWSQNVVSPPENDHFADRQPLAGARGSVVADTTGATREELEPDLDYLGRTSAWWFWRAPADGVCEFSTQGSDFDTALAVFVGDSLGVLEVVNFSDDSFYIDVSSAVGFCAVAGTEYAISVDGYNGDSGLVFLSWSLESGEGASLFRRGEVNSDEAINLTDAVSLLNYLFLGGPAPACTDAADVNDDGGLNLTDAVSLLNFLFLGAQEPPSPGLTCGPDPTSDPLGDCSTPGC